MKYVSALLTTLLLTSGNLAALACDVCQSQQPKVLRGIAHGAGPQSYWDYVIVGSMALIALLSLVYAVRWTLKPGEKETTHIKHSILNAVDP